jgi:hypothetical protein
MLMQGNVLRAERPFVLCVDVGGPKKIGWADSDRKNGVGAGLGEALDRLSKCLLDRKNVALGFEAPIWTPVRTELSRITASRGGIETKHNRAWSAGAGAGALGAALALMPWCLTRIAKAAGSTNVTVNVQRFKENGGLFLWEAFVSGAMKKTGATHCDDAQLACDEFIAQWPDLTSDIPDIPGEHAVNHAVSSAMAAGFSIDPNELHRPALVVGLRSTDGS